MLTQNSADTLITINDIDFTRLRELIYQKCGINLTPAKKTMLASRLRKRLRALNLENFGQYYDYVSRENGYTGELIHMLDAVSTNKTDFFRESKHFDFIKTKALPELIRERLWGPGRKLNIWSAGCSSGEEPYTIAMVLADFISKNRAGDFSILGSDISTRVLKKAKTGVYHENDVEPVPVTMRRNYLMKGKGSQKGYCRIVPELRSRVQFKHINLNNGDDFGIRTKMEIIFCRNVIIYFDRETQKKLFDKFYRQLVPGGFLFIGHSETLHGINDQFKAVTVATYRKPIER